MRAIIVAVNPEGIIGKGGRLPWHYSADLRRFKRVTMGATLIMGRRTWESLPIQPLPGRRNLVVSSRSGAELALPEGAEAYPSLEAALAAVEAGAKGDIWFIGGRQLYQAALPYADLIDMTLVPDEFEPGPDLVYFPELPPDQWRAGPVEVDPEDPRLKHQEWRRRA